MDHWLQFLQFCKYELDSGGPDHHLQLAVEGMDMVKDPKEKAWRAGCYMAPYEINTAAIIWENWPLEKVVYDRRDFTAWIEDTWPYWQLRRERRAARTVKKMGLSMLSYANLMEHVKIWQDLDYEALWDFFNKNLLYFGRYGTIKILEALYRGQVIKAPMPDIRPVGGWSPRLTLTWLFPDEPLLAKGNKDENIVAVHRVTSALKERLEAHTGRAANFFQIEVLLCNYRQVLDERNGRYAGWSLDMDLEHRIKSELWQTPEFPFYELRKKLFPEEHLGEIQGWDGQRKQLCGYRGYFWTDLIYDYNQTTDFAKPYKR